MRVFGIYFYGKPKSNKYLTKYLLIKRNYKAEDRYKDKIENSLVCYQFDNKKEMNKYINKYLSKHDQESVEIYKLTPTDSGEREER